jgi:hypothetical protein
MSSQCTITTPGWPRSAQKRSERYSMPASEGPPSQDSSSPGRALGDGGVLLAGHVDVGIDEAGQHVPVAGVDHSVGRRQTAVGADGDDAPALERQATAKPPPRGHDRAVPDHEVDHVLAKDRAPDYVPPCTMSMRSRAVRPARSG